MSSGGNTPATADPKVAAAYTLKIMSREEALETVGDVILLHKQFGRSEAVAFWKLVRKHLVESEGAQHAEDRD